jgi:hypothetical protein
VLERFLQVDLGLEEAEDALDRLQTERRRATDRLLEMLRQGVTDPVKVSTTQTARRDDAMLTLLGYLAEPRATDPLLELVNDDAIPDSLKLKLISLLYQIDPNVDTESLLGQMQDPREAIQASQREHLARLQSPRELALWLEMMQEQMSPDMRVAFIQSYAELDDPAAVPMLICLCYDPDDEVVLIAMDVLERLKDARAQRALEEVAAYYPSQVVRTEARKTADRLRVRALLVPQVEPTPSPPLHACYLTTIDGSGGQAALISRRLPEGAVRLVDVMFNDHEGIKQCFGLDISEDELGMMLDDMAAEGISPVQVSCDHCMEALHMACEATWQARRPLPVSYVAWRDSIEGQGEHVGAGLSLPDLAMPPEEYARAIEHCHELLLQDEFAYWFLNPDEIGDLDERYLDLVDTVDSEVDASALRDLLRQGVSDLMTERMCALIRGRLRRVAPLLRELYEGDEVWQWAVAAADMLREDRRRRPETHPLLLGMIARSLENAIGEPIDWLNIV